MYNFIILFNQNLKKIILYVELSSFLDAPVDGSPLSIIDEGTDQTVVDNDVEIIPPPKNDHFVELFVDSGGDDCSFEVVIIENDLI